MGSFGGVSNKEVANFQLKIMMGSQYNRVINAKEEKDIIIACLRMAWNDSFRHVSINQYKAKDDSSDSNKKIVLGIYGKNDISSAREKANEELKLDKNNKDDGLIVSEYICQKILGSEIVFKTFLAYASKKTTEEKVEVINDAIKNKNLRQSFSKIKVIDDPKCPLCFGHFQKLFNMAMKLYLCISTIKQEETVEIKASMGNLIRKEMLENADCPIDSVILKALDKKDENKDKIKEVHPYVKTRKNKNGTEQKPFSKFEEIKWSKIGKFDIKPESTETNELKFTCEHYVTLQKIIRDYMKPNGFSNLYFDFENWN